MIDSSFSPMKQIELLHDRLFARFSTLRDLREGSPVYAIEHGLSEDEVANIENLISNLLRWEDLSSIARFPLPLIVVSVEAGYKFEGLWSGYWPVLAGLLGVSLTSNARRIISESFKQAHVDLGFASPNDSPFSRHFHLIAWPITNALAPRQIHGGIATILRDVVLLDGDVLNSDKLGITLRSACLRTGAARLIEWSEDQTRLVTVARAILQQQPGSMLSSEIIERLSRDLMSSPDARVKILRARKEMVSTFPGEDSIEYFPNFVS